MPRSVTELVELLDLETIEDNLFRGRQPDTVLQRVFGGQVAAHALVAAEHTVPERYAVHSLHAYFLRPGDTAVPIVYDVDSVREGRSFATRRVLARQHGRPIFQMSANFQVAEEGLEHQDTMPDVPPPEECVDLADSRSDSGGSRGSGGDSGPDSGASGADSGADSAGGSGTDSGRRREQEEWRQEWAALDVRHAGDSRPGGRLEDGRHPARAQLWMRINGELPDDPLLHVAAFTYASDLSLLAAALVPHGLFISSPNLQAASLDHSIWFHRPFRADDWWLYDQTSPSASGGRGFCFARVFTRDGRLVASVAQEGLIRRID